MNKHKETTQIIIPIKKGKHIESLSRFIYATCRKNTHTEKMLAYIIEHSSAGFYYTLKNSRANCCKRLGLSIDTYNKCIRELISCRLLLTYKNANGSRYGFYKLSPALCKMIAANGNIEFIVKISK